MKHVFQRTYAFPDPHRVMNGRLIPEAIIPKFQGSQNAVVKLDGMFGKEPEYMT